MQLSTPVVTTGGYAFVMANIGTVASPNWQMFEKFHSYGPACSGWSANWIQWTAPSSGETWSSAPSAATLPDGRTVVMAVQNSRDLYYQVFYYVGYPYYRTFYSPWYLFTYWTYPSLNASGLGAPVATLVNGQLNVVLSRHPAIPRASQNSGRCIRLARFPLRQRARDAMSRSLWESSEPT